MRKLYSVVRYLKHKLITGFYFLGKRVTFEKNVEIVNPSSIYIGDYSSIDADSLLSVIKEHFIYKYDRQDPVIRIEESVGISKGTTIFAVNSICIKKNSMIGPYSFISDYDHSFQDVDKPISQQRLTNIGPIVIEEGAWLGAHVTVCSGVKIGKNSIIGAGSVVTKDIPSYSVAVGVPARVIKRFNFKTKNWEKVQK